MLCPKVADQANPGKEAFPTSLAAIHLLIIISDIQPTVELKLKSVP